MTQKMNQYTNEIISIFMMLMLCWALLAGPARDARGEALSAAPVSVPKASKVATEPLRRPANGGRRLFDPF